MWPHHVPLLHIKQNLNLFSYVIFKTFGTEQITDLEKPCNHPIFMFVIFLPGICGFRHFTFPKDPVSRAKWTELVNRKDSPNDSTPRELRERSVICSEYFVGGEPTRSNPYPILKMGYNIVSLHGMLSLQPPRLKLRAINQHLFY